SLFAYTTNDISGLNCALVFSVSWSKVQFVQVTHRKREQEKGLVSEGKKLPRKHIKFLSVIAVTP
ncbi:hypothetical protein PSY31_22305, partial [Shigella flexneri]|nr:hypothetical protein [Shigella flexneri]